MKYNVIWYVVLILVGAKYGPLNNVWSICCTWIQSVGCDVLLLQRNSAYRPFDICGSHVIHVYSAPYPLWSTYLAGKCRPAIPADKQMIQEHKASTFWLPWRSHLKLQSVCQACCLSAGSGTFGCIDVKHCIRAQPHIISTIRRFS